MERREVVVIGGGPAGSTTAALLAQLGHDVLLLDKSGFPRDKACSEYTSPGLLDVLERVGVRPEFEAAGPARLNGMDIISPSGRSLRIRYGDNDHRRYSMPMPRTKLDALLLKYAGECGAEVREGVRVQRLLQDGDNVRGVTIREGAGGNSYVGADLVVGADGLNSIVSTNLGVRSVPFWPRRFGLVAHFEGETGLTDHGEMHVHPWGYCGIAPLGDGTVSTGIALDLRRCGPLGGSREALLNDIMRLFPGVASRLRTTKLVRPIMGVSPIARRVRRTQGRGWALVGDAAGFTDPFTGEGIYRAVRGAELLAEIASEALKKGTADGRGLEPYRSVRREAFRRKAMVVMVIQLVISYPELLDLAATRLGSRQDFLSKLSSVMGDYEDPRSLCSPQALANLIRHC